MKDIAHIHLQPLQKSVDVPRGSSLQDVLFAYGVEFPCGGHGRCKSCRIRVVQGELPATADQELILGRSALENGWRLACRCRVFSDLTIEIGQWEASILSDDSDFTFEPAEGLGIAIDLGTTTLVAQLLDLRTGEVLGVSSGLNPQARYGSDIMSRVQFGLTEEGALTLKETIWSGLGQLVSGVLETSKMESVPVRRVVIVGNTVMHHLFCGIDVRPLSYYPFEPVNDGLQTLDAAILGWSIPGTPVVHFLPCLGGFVGSDILSGILATGLHESRGLVGLVDLGTNGEVVLGNREKMVCASAAAGPAFEGARIRMGMQASTGAISEVEAVAGRPRCHVLGNVAPRGICGSGLVDAVAVGLDLGKIQTSGRLSGGAAEWELAPPVSLCQDDIRELQYAKGAIAAAIRVLLKTLGIKAADLETLHLAGAFGNYINRTSARRIGLIDFQPEKVKAMGNTALRGAKLALFMGSAEDPDFAAIRSKIHHISLAADPDFQDVYVESMFFPNAE